jgi:hypothetical protein
MRAFWKRDWEFSELEGELRARRAEPPAHFVRALAKTVGGERSSARPRLRVALTVALVALAAAAVASAGGVSLAASGTGQLVQVVADLASSSSSPQTTVANSPADNQYKPGKGCGDPNHVHERNFQCKVSINSVSNKEGDSGTTSYVFKISLNDTPLSQVTAAWTTADGSATVANNDYLPAGGTAVFAPGVQFQTVTVSVVGDTVKEPNEIFYVNITSVSANAYIGNGVGSGTIVNDDKATVGL